ncbi:iron-siderophore ABC transporter substrate-binding protein [Nocardiopsis sp. CNT-189]|uniref:iron-siderophore ABC transporter substrate-binding protein n=1 Tax=Nocardiopsis oceanisediminis TaxID=2816862 RepID=UPI003B31E487
MTSSPRRLTGLALLASAAVFATAACSSGAGAPAAESDGDWSAVTVEHAFGSTEITAEPKRVVTIGWSDEATLLELGVVPVGMAASTYAGDEDGYLPWDLEKLDELGEDKPELFNTDDGMPVEDIAALEPDLILGLQSGLEEKEYERLSAVAPTIPYLDEPWKTPWQDAALAIGKALGREDDAQKVVDETEGHLADLAAEHPEFEGTTVAAATVVPNSTDFGFYLEGDARAALLEELGFTRAPFIDELEADEGAFFAPLSREHADRVDTDVLLMWHATPEEREKLEKSDVFAEIDAVAGGRYVGYDDPAEAMAISSPNPLTIPWVTDRLVGDLAEAVEGEA